MILTMFVALYTSRVVLETLGIEDFGIYNVVGGVVTLLSFFNGAMASATQRFLSFEIGRNDFVKLSATFNAVQIIHVCIAVLVFILAETIGLWFLNNYLNLRYERLDAARFIYHFSVLSFMISIIQAPYNAVIVARERMDAYAYISILEVSLKLIIVFLLTYISFDKLMLYGVLLFIVTLIIGTIYRIYVLKNFKETRFQWVKDKELYKELVGYSGWTLFGSGAMVAKGQGVSILLNIFFGTVINASQAIALQVSGAINSFVTSFQMASNPQIVKSYAGNDNIYMTDLVVRTAKFSFYLLFVLTLPVLLEAEYILKLWLTVVPRYTVIFTILILINAWIDSFSAPLVTVIHATGKIKIYQIVIGLIFMLNLPFSYILFKMGFTPTSAFIVNIGITALVFSLRLFFVINKIPEFSAKYFLLEVFFRNIPVVIFSFIVPYLLVINMQPSFMRLLLVILISFFISVISIYLIGLKKNEKIFVKNNLKNSLNKMRNGN